VSAPQPDLSTDLSARQWRWLTLQVGEVQALRALADAVSRGQRAYPLNAARLLRLRLPLPAALPPLPGPTPTGEQVLAAQERLRALRSEMAASIGAQASR